MYKKYLSMPAVPAGKILERILSQKKMSQRQLALSANEYPQRIGDLISGKRRFTLKSSFAIEKALSIDIDGFFYLLQTGHDIYIYREKQELLIHPDLSKFSKALFWDTKIELMNWIRGKEWIIQRVFSYGNRDEIKEVIKFYGTSTIKSVLNKLGPGSWKEDKILDNTNLYISGNGIKI